MLVGVPTDNEKQSHGIIMKRLLAFLFFGSVAPALFAAVPSTYDGFPYAVGSDLGSPSIVNAQGYFWNIVATASNPPAVKVVSGNLSVPGLMPATGNMARYTNFGTATSPGVGQSARFSLPAAVNSGTLYFSDRKSVV